MAAVEYLQARMTDLVLAANVDVNPSSSGLGHDALQKLINWGAGLGLMLCAGAFTIGAAQWALGKRSQNYGQATDGKDRMFAAVGGAFGVGAVAAIINFFYTAGAGVH